MSIIEDDMRKAVTASGRTRYALAKQAKIDQAHLLRFMRSDSGLSFDVFERLADVLGLRVTLTPKGKTTKGR
jgi:transcriptional regulator with XRE-family HTH domain